MIHYHGTPVTPQEKLLEMAGSFFCVSFANPRNLQTCHEIGQGVMLDNGAFTFWNDKKRATPPWSDYYRWVEPWLDLWTTWAVIPDTIDGDADENDALVDEWPFGDRGAPVWHLHEPLGRLERLIESWPLVCLGSSGDYGDPGSPLWKKRMARAMDIACDEDGVPITRLHMLRGLKFSNGPYPFYSADSTNIARNHAGNNTRGRPSKDPFEMLRRIDAMQPSPRWQR